MQAVYWHSAEAQLVVTEDEVRRDPSWLDPECGLVRHLAEIEIDEGQAVEVRIDGVEVDEESLAVEVQRFIAEQVEHENESSGWAAAERREWDRFVRNHGPSL